MNVSQLSMSFGARQVLDGVGFRLDPGERLAVVGRNGEGKTTLLRILAGQLAPDAGQISLPKGGTVALHDQRPPLLTGLTLEQYVAEGLVEAQQAEAELAALEARMAAGDGGDEVMAAYERAGARLERAGGYAWRSWMERVLRGLGIQEDALSRPLDGFSGGELTRASLARALVGRPDVLLLDEPTNHLDLEAVEWLEGALREVGAAVVLVSHDRWFLESVATRVLEIEGGRTKLWPMRYSEYRREKALAIDRQGAQAERQAAEIARLERFVTRWKAGTKSRQAASRQKQLDKITPIAAPVRRRATAFGFPKAERSARLVLEADRLTVGVPGRTLIRDAGFAIERGQRVALIAPNGAGKTTLLETLLGARPPEAGRISLGHKVQPTYFSQHGVELRDDRTILESTLEIGTMTNTQARTLLGNLLFPGEIVDRKVELLSGGERRRLGLVRLIAQGGNLLVLDEPTNHLDTESREALEDAIEAYEGTVLMVSHDRALIDVVATHTLAIEDGTLRMRTGGYSDLLAAREAAAATPAPARAPARATKKSAPARTGAPARTPAREAPPRRGKNRVRQLEGKIAALEGRIAAVEGELAEAATAADREAVAARGEEHRSLQQELAWLMHEWETAAESAGVA